MARIAKIMNAGKLRVALLDSEIDTKDAAIAMVEGHGFPVVPGFVNAGGIRTAANDALAISANASEYPDTFFVGKPITLA